MIHGYDEVATKSLTKPGSLTILLEVIENLKRNMLMGVLKVCAVKAPSYGVYRKDMLEDLAVLTGGTCLTYDSDLYVHNMTADMLGTCKKVIVTKDSTTIIEGNSDPEKIANRIELIRDNMQNCEGEFLTEHHKMRLARLCSGISRIYVGGKTELEMKERKDRVDDAVCAIKAASEEGIVAGGGITYLGIYLSLFDQIEAKNKGFEILTCGLISIFAKILENAGKVICIELDPKMVSILTDRFSLYENFELIIVAPISATTPTLNKMKKIYGMYRMEKFSF